jgi:hypothetical protein
MSDVLVEAKCSLCVVATFLCIRLSYLKVSEEKRIWHLLGGEVNRNLFGESVYHISFVISSINVSTSNNCTENGTMINRLFLCIVNYI